MKKNVRVFAPGTVANMGCGFDVMGMTLNGVGDIVSVSVGEGDGLSIENKSGVELPDKELVPGYLDGVTGEYAPPQGYFVDEGEAEAFDREFPPKVKLKLPGQLFSE